MENKKKKKKEMKALPMGHMLAVQLLTCMQQGAEHGADTACVEASAECIIQWSCPSVPSRAG